MPYSIAQINQLSQDAFVAVLGKVFEDTPAIAKRVWYQRPFTDVAGLHQSMIGVVRSLSWEEQLALLRAHPDLGSKAKMAEASVKEQAGVGLAQMSPQEYDRFQYLNQAYKDKFGFPFIVAVKNHTKSSILDTFDCRLKNTVEAEMEQALIEIAQIAHFRLVELVNG